MRILIISFAFPPFNSIGGVRVGKTAKYLSKLGHDVRVLTARDQPFQSTLPVEVESQNVVYSKWLNISGPAKIVRDGTGALVGNGARRRGITTVIKNVLGSSYRSLLYFPDTNIGWFPFAERAGSDLIKNWKPDLLLASAPPATSLLVAARLSKKNHIPWVADLRDLWVDHQYYNQPGWRRVLEERLERRTLSSASALITVSEPLADTLRRKYQKPTSVVLNGFDASDYPPDSHVPYNDGRLRILYTGVVYPGRQDPTPLFEALQLLGDAADKVRIVFHGIYLSAIRDLIARCKLEANVEVNDSVPYREALKMQCEADVLLLLLWTDPAERGVYTGKLFEYIGARRPILAVGPSGNVAADMILDKHAGIVTNDPVVIAKQLESWLSEKQQLGSIPPLPEQTVAGVSREEQIRAMEKELVRVYERGATIDSRGQRI